MADVAVIGAGAIGGVLAGRLASAGHRVSVVARGAHGAVMTADGLRLDEAGAPVKVAVAAAVDDLGPQDLTLLTVKAHSVAAIAPALGRMAGHLGIMVGIQNGLPWWFTAGPVGRLTACDPTGNIRRHLSPDMMLPGIAILSAQVVRPGVAVHLPAPGDRLELGEIDGRMTPRLAAAAALLRDAGWPVEPADDIERRIWVKLLGNVAVNPLAALGRCRIGAMLDRPSAYALVRTLMAECAAVARGAGLDLRVDLDVRMARLDSMRDAQPSMLQDLLAGRPMEVAAIVDAPVELAGRLGIRVPSLMAVQAAMHLLQGSMAMAAELAASNASS